MAYDANNDPFRDQRGGLSAVGRAGQAVTPSDTADLATYARIVVLATGDVRVLPADNGDPASATAAETVLFVGLAAGTVLPFHCRRVLATGTTATVATVI